MANHRQESRMSDLELPFRLPVSCVRIAGTRAFVHDAVLGRDDTSAQATVTLDVVGEHEPSLLRVAEGLLVDTSVAFEWTDDGRLVTSSVELTGRAGTVAVGAVSTAASIAGVLLGSPAMALSCAGAATATAHRLARSEAAIAAKAAAPQAQAAEGGAQDAADARAAADSRAVAAAYRSAHPDEAEALDTCAALVPELVRGLADALRRVPAGADDKALTETLAGVHAVEGALTSARAEVGALDEHFRAWRAGTIAQRLEDYEFLLELDSLVAAAALPELADGRLRSSGSGDEANVTALAAVQAAFEALGLVVIVEGDPGAGAAGAESGHGARPPVEENEILVRLPRRVRLTTYELGAAGQLVKRSSNAALVMDARCRQATVRISRTLFGKRAVRLGFSAGSALASLRIAATSEAAGAADAAGALPGAVGLALERSKRIVDRVAALRGAGLDQQISVLTRELQLKRQQIAQAGLLATAGSYAELAQLKRQVALLEQRKALLALEADLGVAAPVATATAAAFDAADDDATLEP
jgi:hypothetical protein